MAAFILRQTPLTLPRPVFRWLAKRIGTDRPVLRGALRGTGAGLKEYAAALSRREAFIFSMERFLANWDAWLCPVAPFPAFAHTKARTLLDQVRATVDLDGQPVSYLDTANFYTSIFNLTGNPAVVLPFAQSKEGLPIGIQVVGCRWHDMSLLHTAETLTEITGTFRHPPGY